MAPDRPEPIRLGQQLGAAPAKQGTLGYPLSSCQDGVQDPFCRRGRQAVVEEPADRVIKISACLERKIPEAAHAAALVFRAIVARTRSATSSPVR